MLFKKSKGTSGKSELKVGSKLVNGYELRSPSGQNAVDLVAGWTTRFPDELVIEAGEMDLLHDGRLSWAIDCFGNLTGKRVMELGPLEGAHTAMLEATGAHVDAVESGGLAYIKCLITKEILGLKNARFFLGDCNAWLADHEQKYDLIVASGVLYHMEDPLRLLDLIAKRTDDLFLWTMVIDDPSLAPTRIETLMGVDVRLYLVAYGTRTKSFCGGANPQAMWVNKSDLTAVLRALGYTTLLMAHETVNPYGTALSYFASRRAEDQLLLGVADIDQAAGLGSAAT